MQPSVALFIKRHRIVFALCGIVVSTAVILPACDGGTATTPQPSPFNDLKITKTGLVSGQTVTYTITVTNIGASGGPSGLFVTDEVQSAPAGSAFTSATGGTCSGPISAYVCNIGAVTVGVSKVLTLVLTVPAAGGGVENCASVPDDSVATNNRSCTGNSVPAAPLPASITIIKDAQPDNAQDFSFTSTTSGINPFKLDDDADPTLSNKMTFSNLSAGTFTFTEAATTGWSLANITCTPSAHATTSVATSTVSIALVAGDSIACTFVNAINTPQVVSVTPTNPTGSASAQPFTLTGTGFVDGSVTLRDLTTSSTFANQAIATNTGTQIVINPVFGIASTTHNWSAEVITPFGSSGQKAFTVAPPTPVITAITTTPTPPTGGTAFALTVTGSNFASNTGLIQITGPGCTPCTIANSALTTKSSTSYTGTTTLNAGTYTVTVLNDAPSVTTPTSNAMSLVVNSPPILTPTVTAISPASPTGSASSQQITLTGTNFASGATLTLRDLTANTTMPDLKATTINNTAIIFDVAFGVAPASHSWTAQVINTGNLASGQLAFTVGAPTPAITTVTTSPSPARTNTVTVITLSGVDFASDASRIVVTGQGCEPCVISNTALTTKTSTTLVGPLTFPNAGTFTLTVQNAILGPTGATGPTSAGKTVTVTAGGAGG